MTLQLFGHPFSSYTWKALIALYENDTPFAFRELGPDHPENGAELGRRNGGPRLGRRVRFHHADCAAAPSLFYADWAHPIAKEHATLKAYRARLLARPSVVRCVEAARPYRGFFPLGAPDRD